jgi:hypothetical protein
MKVKINLSKRCATMQTKSNRGKAREVFWKKVGGKIEDDRSCLAAFMALHSAEVLERVKPANLMTMHDRVHICGRNLYRLWEEFADELLGAGGLRAHVLHDCGRRRLVLLYSPILLEGLLAEPKVQNFLRKAGYSAYRGRQQALDELTLRAAQGDFPHEIGLFLGYPLKDVAGFMGWAAIPFSCNGPWRVYGDPARSLRLAKCHKACRARMAERLDAGCDPTLCLCPMRRAAACPTTAMEDDFSTGVQAA